MNRSDWQKLCEGDGCWMDAPRPESNAHLDLVARLSVSSLYLVANQTYRGQCMLIFDPRHAARPDQLSAEEWSAFCGDLYRSQQAIVGVTRPDHINVECLGNVVPHLHWHIIPRYVDDPRWGMPVWTTPLSAMPETHLEASQREHLLWHLRAALGLP